MSKYHCECGGLILPDFDSFKLGDTVNCMFETHKPLGNGLISVNQRAFTGIIMKISGDDFDIKSKNKIYDLKRGEFTPADAPGPIEYFRIGKCSCSDGIDENTLPFI
ncbi:hypothetical protein [Acinetobacter rathckeae]|uniref:hypothetical protein n=1 Tax=Acinetobacter rathckeae TaxID=2605272 RepID=UPI0018A29B9B|nr:hypothetical protein [Acinetobacter rathckeae]MBF7687712.1 hypothetical protein [Acinetobacter rathckeae]MBF7688065.1 hypothetical protein [Acinetobacter rathckeae]